MNSYLHYVNIKQGTKSNRRFYEELLMPYYMKYVLTRTGDTL